MPGKKFGALSNPTHKIVGPDGKEFILIRQTRNTVRMKILFGCESLAPGHPIEAGEVSEGWGPSAADDIMMGRWSGVVAFHFTSHALAAMPDGTHCIETDHDASDYDYQTDVLWSGWGKAGYDAGVALRRAQCPNFGSLRGWPVTRPQRELVRAKLGEHLAALRDGSYRRDDGPMILNPAPVEPGKYRATYIRGEGSQVPAKILPEFIADAERFLRYLDFLDSIPDLPERARKAPATV